VQLPCSGLPGAITITLKELSAEHRLLPRRAEVHGEDMGVGRIFAKLVF
jgi:hypothetical protein